jgi:glycosyltransferase involved in cell wall biosynthesis
LSSPAITLDIRMLNASGIGTYLQQVSSRLIGQRADTKWHLLGTPGEIGRYPWAHVAQVTLHACRAPIYSLSEQIELLRTTPPDTDLFWSPHYNVPLLYRGKLLVTVHDVLHLARPEFTGGVHRRAYAHAMFRTVRSKANAIICVSRFSADELVRLTGAKRESITVVHEGVDPSWFCLHPEACPHPRPYLLFVGNVKPHKNLGGLLKAFTLLKDDIAHDLVIVGKREGFLTGDPGVVKQARRLGGRVHFTGYVDDELLRRYYAHAYALVFPSFYEGFGLPPLEAMASGCPVIASNVASLPEVCGDAAEYCAPGAPASIAAAIRRVIESPELRQEMRAKGRERARRFTWERCASETQAVINHALTG